MPERGPTGPVPSEPLAIDPIAERADGRVRARSVVRLSIVGALAVLVVAASWVVAPATSGPGPALVAAGLGLALVFGGLNSPVLAVVLLLVTLFLREALNTPVLPVELFLLAFCGVVGAAAIALTRDAGRAPKLGPVEAVMALYVLWNIGSAIAPHDYSTTNPGTGESGAVYHVILTGTLIPFTLYLVGRFVFDRESAVRTLLWTMIVFTGYSTLVSILQFHAPALVWPRYIVEPPPESGWVGRAIGVFSQPVANGLLLVIGFAIAAHLAYRRDAPRWQRLILALLAITSLYAIYLTYTRAVWLILGITLVLGAVLLARSRTGYVVTILATCLVIGLNWAAFTSEDRSAGGVGSPDEVGDRLNMIATAWWAVQERPVAGWGIGRFIPVNTYHHQQWSPEVDWIRGYAISSHVNELGIAAELGLVGLVLWLAVLVLIARRLLRAVATLPRDGLCGRDLAVIALIVFIICIVTGLTVDLRFFDFTNAAVMLLVGVAVGWADREVMARHAGAGAGFGTGLAAGPERLDRVEVRRS